MKLEEIIRKIAFDSLGAAGSFVECMVKTEFEEKNYGIVHGIYRVIESSCAGLRLEGLCGPVMPERFRQVSLLQVKK